ncbi:hypothetical protein Cadr_000017383 [Camelus dromedarius]|uniref:Uncharacterized protein n=1 Tax=Camelus dromedarius TaxID=9838 RepID=A0A5N4DFQ7_CAMDR|nr:hypothetical protein Cadr_000017383 [Camelus dromedarius]
MKVVMKMVMVVVVMPKVTNWVETGGDGAGSDDADGDSDEEVAMKVVVLMILGINITMANIWNIIHRLTWSSTGATKSVFNLIMREDGHQRPQAL